MRDLRIAAAQVRCRVGDVAGNLAMHRQLVRRAQLAGAEIICFPELSLCGYPLDGDLPRALAEPLDGEVASAVSAVSDETGLVVLAGMLESAPSGAVYNTQLVAAPGDPLKRFRKAHVPTSEIGRFRPGGELPVFRLPGATVGVQVCYDTHFPEATTVQALAGAEVVFMPHASAGGESREEKRERWLRYLPARAYDNSVFAVVVNQCDADRGFPGLALAFDPWGKVIAEASADAEDLLVVDLPADALVRRRAVAETFFTHFRRPELYAAVAR